MTTFAGEATMAALGVMVSRESAPDWINRDRPAEPTPTVNFTWSPTGTSFSYTIGSTTYAPNVFRTPTGVPITFTAMVVMPLPRYIAEYHWDFGDGTKGWGNPVAHTFVMPNEHARAVLQITDDRGDHWVAGHQLYVTKTDQVLVHRGIVV